MILQIKFMHSIKAINIYKLLLIGVIVVLGFPRFSSLAGNMSKAESLLGSISREPELETYTTDMKAYLRTYYEVRKGKPYYASLAQAVRGDATRDNFPGEVWGWKSPLIFYLWAALPGPSGISVY